MLPKFIADAPQECRAGLAELHKKIGFTEDHMETFQINHGQLTLDTLPSFEEAVAKEMKSAGNAPKPRRGSFGGAPAKRPRTSFVPLASSVGTVLGRPVGQRGGLSLLQEISPQQLKNSQALDDGRDMADVRTPERSPQKAVQVEVTLKASLNANLDIQRAAFGGNVVPARVELLGARSLWSGPKGEAYRWMGESLEDRAASRDQRLAALEPQLVEAMRKRHADEEVAVGTIGVPSQAETILCGRVVCEGLEGRLNERSMLLEGSQASSRGARVQLNLSTCASVAAFPGQLVSVLGRSGMTGTTFHARDFIPGIPMPPPSVVTTQQQTQLLVLSGPFCLRAGLDYTPLRQGLEYAKTVGSQVVVLCGPFVDCANNLVVEGDLQVEGAFEPCSLQEFYADHVLPVLTQSLAGLRRARPSTQVLIVPSLDEALCFHPLPQPPLDTVLAPVVGSEALDELRSLDVTFLPNPAHLRINGTRVSITSTDALSPILRSGLVLRPEERKIEQALRLLQQQGGLFPVLPREPAQVCEARAAALDFPEDGGLPDICIFPSMSGTPAGTVVDGRVFVNPGTVCRPAALGTVAELFLVPAAPTEEASKVPLSERLRVDIQALS